MCTLEELFDRKNLSVAEVAHYLHCPPIRLWRYCVDTTQMPTDLLERIARLCNVTVDEIYIGKLKDWKKSHPTH